MNIQYPHIQTLTFSGTSSDGYDGNTPRKRLQKMINRFLATMIFTMFYLISIGQVSDFTHDFDPMSSNSCAPISVLFTSTSTGATSYAWTINGANFSVSEMPSRAFANGGAYTVCLTASSASGSDQSCQTLNINEPADVEITNTPVTHCSPYASTVNFTSNEIITSATIDYGDGVIDVITPNSTTFSANHTYTQEGNYSVTISAIDANGCSTTASSSNIFTIRNVKELGFSVSLSACQIPLTAAFNNTTSNLTNYSYSWDFGDGSAGATTTSTTHDYNTPGAYDVSLTATDLLTGCSDSYVLVDAINSESVSTIDANEVDNGDCSSKEMNFSVLNISIDATVVWDFGDGTASGGATTNHVYSTAGCFTPRADITTPEGCNYTVTYGSCINSIGPNDASFSLSGDLETCNATIGTTVQHTSNSAHAVSWSWDFGDGNSSTQENPSHTYTGYGAYQPTLTTTYADGCSESFTDPLIRVVIQEPVLSIVTDTTRGCIPFDVNYSIQGSNDPITSINWNFGAGASPMTSTSNSPSVTYASVGDYTVSATIQTAAGCTFTVNAVDLIDAGDVPNVFFQADMLTSCVDEPIQFTDLSDNTVDEWEWDFGNGSSTQQDPSYSFTEADSFEVTLKAWYNGCPAEYTQVEYIKIGEPKADFSWVYDCNVLNTINITDRSTGADDIWYSFGDGSPLEYSSSPTHTFSGEGIYQVIQYTENYTTGCIDEQRINIDLKNPVAQFDLRDTSFCLNDVVTIVNLSTNIYDISWSIGNDPTGTGHQVIESGSNGADAQIRFMQLQDYTDFTLTYSIHPSCPANRSITYNKTVSTNYVFPFFEPIVDNCLPATITLDHSLADVSMFPLNDPTVEYNWTISSRYGDTMFTGTNPVIPIDEIGIYDIDLTMTNGAGCSSSISIPKNVNIDTTDIGFDWNMINCSTREIEFINTSNGITAESYEWSFGDGGSSSASNTSHQYGANGEYDVRLILHTSNGCSDTLSKTIQVYQPIADFVGDNLLKSCPNPALITNFTNNTDGGDTYEWTFGDGGGSTLENPAHAFSVVDSFDITLIATSVNGCTDTITKADYIQLGGPLAEIEYSTLASCTGSDIQFIITGDGINQYTWDFGDGNALSSSPSTTSDTLTFAYATPGKYQPILIAEDATGCRITQVGLDSINIFDLTVDFTADIEDMCSNDLMDVSFAAQLADPSIVDSIGWLLPGSDTPTATGTNISGVGYSTTGAYDVSMITYTSACIDTLVKTDFIQVYDPPSFTAPNDTSVCNGSGVQLEITDLGLTYTWDNGATLSCDDCPNPVASPTSNTTYTITGTSPGGCSTTRTVNVTVDDPNVANITTPSVSLCVGANRQITLASPATNPTWTSATQTLSCTSCLSQNVTIAGSGRVDVSYDYLSCLITETLLVDAWDPDSIDESVYSRSICDGDAVDLSRPSYPGTIEWRADDINSAPLTSTIFNPSVDTRYYISVSHYGCTAIDSFDITIDEPSITLTPDMTICAGDTVTLTAFGGPSYSYQWDVSGTRLSCYNNCASPEAYPLTTTTYEVTADNGTGCIVTETVTVTVNDPPTTVILPDTIPVCLGAIETLTLPNTVSNVTWTSALALSQSNGLTTDVTATTSADVEVSYEVDFCTVIEVVHFKVWDRSSVDAGPDDIVCRGEEVTLPTNFPGVVEWRAGSLTSAPIAGDKVYPYYPTKYYLSVTNHGCTATDSIAIDINLPSVSVSADITICKGESTQLVAIGDTTVNDYDWETSGLGLSCYDCLDPIATPDRTTTYVILSTNPIGCTATDTVVVTVNDSIPNFLADTINVCLGTDVSFDMTNATNVSWVSTLPMTLTNGDLNAEITASDSTFVDVTYDWNTCTYTERITFLPWDPMTVSAGPDQFVCEGELVVLPLSPVGTTIWRTGSAAAAPMAANFVNPTTPTTYFIEVNYNGCTGVDSVFVDIDFPVITTSGDATICLGETTPLNAFGDLGNTYVWSPSADLDDANISNPMASPTSTTTYTVTATNTNGCTVSETLDVTVNDPQSNILGDTIEACLGAQRQISITPLAGTSNIFWSTNIAGAALSCTTCNDPTFTAADTGTVTLTYDFMSCSFTETMFIDTWDESTLDAGADHLICLGDIVPLDTNYNGVVEWREGSLNNPVLFSNDVSPTVDTWYYLSLTRYGCTGVDSIIVRINRPTLEIDQPDRICVGSSEQLQVRGLSDPSMTFLWDNSQPGLSCLGCDNPIATPQYTSTYTVTGTNSFGCAVSENVTVTVDQDTANLFKQDTIHGCINSPFDILLDVASYPGVDTNSITWTTTIPIDCADCYHPQLSLDHSGLLTLNYNYNSCAMQEDIYVVAWNPDDVEAGDDQTICAGEEVQLDRNFPGTVQWYYGSMTSASLTGSTDIPTASGRYYLRVDNYGCHGIDSMDVIVLDNADIRGGVYPMCEGDSIYIDVLGDADAVLFNNAGSLDDPTSFSPLAFPTITTEYLIVGQNNGCAQDTAVIEVVVSPLPEVDMRLPAQFIEGDQIRLQADVNARDNLTYIWTPADMIDCTSCALPLFTPTETTQVSLTVIDDDSGCMTVDTATITQKFICGPNSIGMPSAFSPNNDGINDHIVPVSLNQITSYKIFNRWGELVHFSDGSNLGWDGRFNGAAIKRGVYVYVVEGVCRFDGTPLMAKGDFMLVR